MKYIPIGSVTVPASWLAVLIAFVITYTALRIYVNKEAGEMLGNLFFNIVIIWKLSVIVTDFQTVKAYPMSIVYFHGGAFGWYLALAAAGFLVMRQAAKERWTRKQLWLLVIAAVSWQSLYELAMLLFTDGTPAVKAAVIILFAGALLFGWRLWHKGINDPEDIALLFAAVHFAAAAVQGKLFGISLITAWIACAFVYFIAFRMKRKGVV